jgi:multidrug efflux pump subunit AcrB
VAYIINPVFAVDFMKPHNDEDNHKKRFNKGFKITSVVFAVIALLSFLAGNVGLGSFSLTLYGLYCLNRFVLYKMILKFQGKTWPNVQEKYKNAIEWALQKNRPIYILISTVLLLVFSIMLTAWRQPKVEFFPKGDPNFVYTYIALPIGTDQTYTDSITRIIEDRIFEVVGDSNPIVESIISNVAVGASNPQSFDFSTAPHLGKVSVAFVPFGKRDGKSTVVYLDQIRNAIKGIPGAEITVEQEEGGPPTGKPINIEITGDDFDELTSSSRDCCKRARLHIVLELR